VRVDTAQYRVAGVAADFVADGFFDAPVPAVLRWTEPENYRFLIVRTRAENLQAVQDWLAATWKGMFPYRPYAGKFQDEVLAESLQVSENVARMGWLYAAVALLLTVSGLYALVSLTLLKRRKEIAVRRVLGAPVRHLAWLLNRHYVAVLIGGALLGALAGRAFALALLDSIFKVHAGVGWSTLLYAALLLLTVAVATMAVKLRENLKRNPAQTLKVD
jgi:ABC-type antimicrobial peptide transport system permease subunit